MAPPPLFWFKFHKCWQTLRIQNFIQTNPGQLANGQRFLTISFIIFGVVVIIYILMVIFMVVGFIAAIFSFIYRVSVEQNIKRFYSFAQLFFIAAFAVFIVNATLIVYANDNIHLRPAAWIEDGFVRVAFVSNLQADGWQDIYISGNKVREREWAKFACNNLPPDSWVAFASDKVIPDEDVMKRGRGRMSRNGYLGNLNTGAPLATIRTARTIRM